jgi:hypothetical protein
VLAPAWLAAVTHPVVAVLLLQTVAAIGVGVPPVRRWLVALVVVRDRAASAAVVLRGVHPHGEPDPSGVSAAGVVGVADPGR